MILATLMVGLMAGCGNYSGGDSAGRTDAEGMPCPPSGHGQAAVQVGVKDPNGARACRELLGPPFASNPGPASGTGQDGGHTASGTPSRPVDAKPDSPSGAQTGSNSTSKPGSATSSRPGTNASSEPGSNASSKPGSNSSSKPDSKPQSQAGSNPDPKPGSGTDSKPQDQAPPAPPVKLDKPTEPAVAYTGKNGAKLVALTFDDGPDNRYTPAILDILKAKHIHATFFTVGLQVKRYGAVMKRIVDEGSEIGNHTYAHKDLSKLDSNPIMNQIKWTDTLIQKQAGYVPRLVRAPYGASSPLLKRIVADNKRELVFWTVDTKDWEGSTVTAMRANVNKNTHPGGIILMHSFGSKHIANTVQLLPLIIKDLEAKGYSFVTVGELLDAKAQHRAAAAK
ncbi:polysaccharide deacetylase family protein [Paenibacillus glycinis]|uniref:Polysaccharide deacetylase family protein n=1 Tax=Paenibacillus glycinis TaxID=2697035 RepID=A0ABW9XTE0_9BACL|nr:polysaccharide deacetylase family protein [Paenibacillus glycinis]NBD25587.1 polysaccharide deacetylase family protein [Paenibacillus glycinis]